MSIPKLLTAAFVVAAAVAPHQALVAEPYQRTALTQSQFETREECYTAYGCLAVTAPFPFCPSPDIYEICEQYP